MLPLKPWRKAKRRRAAESGTNALYRLRISSSSDTCKELQPTLTRHISQPGSVTIAFMNDSSERLIATIAGAGAAVRETRRRGAVRPISSNCWNRYCMGRRTFTYEGCAIRALEFGWSLQWRAVREVGNWPEQSSAYLSCDQCLVITQQNIPQKKAA